MSGPFSGRINFQDKIHTQKRLKIIKYEIKHSNKIFTEICLPSLCVQKFIIRVLSSFKAIVYKNSSNLTVPVSRCQKTSRNINVY